MQARPRHQGGQALHELQGRHDDMDGAVAPRAFELQHELAGTGALEPFVGDRGAGDGAAQALEFLALHPRHNVVQHVLSKPCALAHRACGSCAARAGSVCKLSTFCPARAPSAMR